MNALVSLSLTLLAAGPQDPTEVLARYQLEGKPSTVTKTDLALEMAFHLRRRQRGQETCEVLVDTLLTRRAAERQGVMPSDDDVRAFWAELQQQLRAAGRRPEEFAAVRNTSTSQWFADLAVQIAQERLVRRELSLGPKEAVSGGMQKLWLQEERRKAKIVTDPDALPPGSAVRVDDTEVPIIDLGLLLLRTSEDHERDRFIQQFVTLQTIEAVGRREGLRVDDADLDAAIQRRREDVAKDPRYSTVSLEQLLKAEGLSIPALRQLRVFRGQVLLGKVAEHRFPTTELLAEVRRDRPAVLALVGPRRHLGLVFLRALDEPNALVPLDFAAATRQLEAARQRLDKETFENVARILSQDPASKPQGGDVGWHRHRSDQLPTEVLDAAFQLEADDVSQPVRTSEGCYLVKVLAIDPEPSDAELVQRLRDHRAKELSLKLLQEAAIEICATANPMTPGGR